MMNINDPDIDLGTRVSSSSGAGANANSRLDMPFAASDSLSELVWLPNNGLSLKCANLQLKPFLSWNVPESIKDISMSHSVSSKGSRGVKISDEKKMCMSSKMLDGGGNCGGKATMLRSSRVHSSSNFDAHRRNRDVKKASEIHARSLPNLQLRDKPDDETTSVSGGVHKNKTTAPMPIPAPTLMMLESSAENDLGRLATESRICLYREKGKVKAPSDGDMCARSSNDEDNSHGSMESCNSTGLFRGVKRPNFGQVQIIGSKRTRNEMQRAHESTSTVKPDSSFMKWISNMVKGLSDCSKEGPSPVAPTIARSNNVVLNETTDCTRQSKGFQTMFQSMYNPSNKDNRALADGKNENSCKQIVLACTPNSSERTNASEIPECKRLKGDVSPSHSSREKVNSSSEKTGLNIPLPMSYMPGKTSPFSSLWITRLYTNLDNRANDDLFLDQKTSDDCAGDRVRASAAMTSVFAKRLDALRHIIHPSETKISPSFQLTCLFCGKNGHDLQDCPKLTATELKDLLVKMSSFDKIKESPCLCIRCFQLDHWAISCPFASPHENRRSGQDTSCPLQIRSDDKCSSYWKVSSKRPSTSNLFQNSSSSEHHLKDKPVFPPRKIVDAWNDVPEKDVFAAISKLRLSRANILRCMNSNIPLSHLNGFFLRLRVGKLEGDLVETTYYVACITGDSIERINSESKKSVLVDVGGVKSYVGSQYISNHDFLEDEIKAWWSRIVKNGCKIPSLHELNSKYEHRKRLSL